VLAIQNALVPFAGTRVDFQNLTGDTEGRIFAFDIAAALRISNWVVSGPSQTTLLDRPIKGVSIGVKSFGNPAAFELQRALKAQNVYVFIEVIPEIQQGEILVIVGNKPDTINTPSNK